MGMDLLDAIFRIEKKFDIKLPRSDFLRIVQNGTFDCTAGDLHELICEKCKENNVPIPKSSWRHLQIIISKASGISPWKVRREALLIKDLGMDG